MPPQLGDRTYASETSGTIMHPLYVLSNIHKSKGKQRLSVRLTMIHMMWSQSKIYVVHSN